MFQKKAEQKAAFAWAAAAVSAPAAQAFGAMPWYGVLLWGLLAGGLLSGAMYLPRRRIGKGTAVLTLLVLTLGAAKAAAACPGSWQGDRGQVAIPLFLLLLSAWAACRGPAVGARYGAVIFLLLVFLHGVTLLFAVPDVKGAWLLPRWQWDGGLGVLILMIPGALCILPLGEKRSPLPWAAGTALFGAALSAVTMGVLSPAVAGRSQGAYLKMASGVSIFGIAERFEALVSSAMTMGWFCLLSLLFAGAGSLWEILVPGKGKWGVWLSALASGVAAIWISAVPVWTLGLGAVLCLLPRIRFRRKGYMIDKGASG